MTTQTAVTHNAAQSSKTRMIASTAMLSAVAFILMYIEMAIPVMPSFIKFDISDLPALMGSFAFGPIAGMIICLIKNLLHLAFSQSMLVGELSNFMLGCAFVLPAGLIYQHRKTKKNALIGGIVGALVMGVFSIFSNYFIVYPAYYKLVAPEDVIISAYDVIASGIFKTHVSSTLQCLICFNLPFTIIKGLISVLITYFIYKPLSPILKGGK